MTLNKVSTEHLEQLIQPAKLKELCKSISVLEAIICPEWDLRYYSYQKTWSENEAIFEMRNGQGDHLLILFQKDGICINGFAKKSKINTLSNGLQKTSALNIDTLPEQFNEFIFEEPVKSIGTSFCIWSVNGEDWKVGNISLANDDYKDGSEDLLELLDGHPMTYKIWAEEYYECDLNIKYIEEIYKGKLLSKEMVDGINPDLVDYEQLKEDLEEIGYTYDF